LIHTARYVYTGNTVQHMLDNLVLYKVQTFKTTRRLPIFHAAGKSYDEDNGD